MRITTYKISSTFDTKTLFYFIHQNAHIASKKNNTHKKYQQP